MDNRAKSRRRSRPAKRFSVYRIGNRNSHAKAYDAESIHSDISEPVVVIEGLKIKYVLFFFTYKLPSCCFLLGNILSGIFAVHLLHFYV